MISARWHKVSRGGDEGATLLLALIFVGLIATVIASLLPYAQAGIGEAAVARDVRAIQNAADGAVQGAIQQIRPNSDFGTQDGPACPPYVAPPYTTTVGSTTQTTNITVTCESAPGVTTVSPDVPPYAIVTTDGGIDASGNHALSIDGGIYASGDLTVPNSGVGTKYIVVGPVYTRNGGTCTSVFSSVDIVHCPADVADGDPDFPAVDYESVLGATASDAQTTIDGLAKDPLGECVTNDGEEIVQFEPGYYTRVPQLDPDTCTGPTDPDLYWFAPCATGVCSGQTTPGIYYLDFADSTYDNYDDEAFWNLNQDNIGLIGGTLKDNWSAKDPGHQCDRSEPGVQVVLGGGSRLSTGNGSSIELCASKTSDTQRQRIALYQLASSDDYGVGTVAKTVTTGTQIPATTSSNTGGSDSNWSGAGHAGARKTGDGLIAQAIIANTSNTYGLEVAGYSTDAAFPVDGSLITSAEVKIRHLELMTSGTANVVLTVHYADGTDDTCDVPSVTSGGTVSNPTVDTTVDLMACGSHLANADYRWRLLHDPDTGKSVSFSYEVTGATGGGGHHVATPAFASAPPTGPAGTAVVDGIQLKIDSVAPGLDAGRCQPTDTGTCYSYSNSGSESTANTFFIGSVFTPDTSMNVVVHNDPETIFQRGVVLKSLTVDVNASSTQIDSPFQLPHSASIDRTVLFTAYDSDAYNAGDLSDPLLRARVRFIDCRPAPSCADDPNAEGSQVWPGRSVNVQRWTALR